MISPLFIRFAIVALLSVGLVGCGRTESYRYKLTLAVNTPNGVKRGSSVGEVAYWQVSIPARGTTYKLNGEALYLDLGLGARPLIALLGSHPRQEGDKIPRGRDAGLDVGLMRRIYGLTASEDYIDDVPRIARMRGPHKINPADLPDLVTFADVDDPKSVVEVDPNDLEATLGENVTWNEIMLESTDEPITTGIKAKLPWLPAYYGKMLDGDYYREKRTLANTLSTADFEQSGDLKADFEKLGKAQPETPYRIACHWLTWPRCLFR
jgi:hypothetical protein